jgi:hypothetical protein
MRWRRGRKYPSKSQPVQMQVPIAFQLHYDANRLLRSRLYTRMNCLGALPTGHRRAGASHGPRMFRVSSVPRPGRDVLADLIRPSGAFDDRIGYSNVGRIPAESIIQPMSEEYVDHFWYLLYFSLILLRDAPLDMLTSWADLR